MEAYDFERVSPTALGPVIARGEYTDIPYAKEVLSYLKEHAGPMPSDLIRLGERAAFFEARFKAVSRILAEQPAEQILELASGYSPRGLAYRRGTFVEVDLPKMIAQKREIVAAVNGSIPPYLKLCCASVLDPGELAQCLIFFHEGPIAITAEGLLRYLTSGEKIALAENIKGILRVHGGVWITPDIHLEKWSPARWGPRPESSITSKLGRDIYANYFADAQHARSFFENCGFEVEERPLLEGIRDRVVSLPLAPPDLLDELEHRRVYTLTLRP